ncbi:hypothetical protein WJX84_003758 [Apatococcus fuscideae]|uniref:Uncharacterized protein n=1 Tax=Apatococcus fuscideae TaxID=2026836 RepID=A0AAW1TCA8_9CHLO
MSESDGDDVSAGPLKSKRKRNEDYTETQAKWLVKGVASRWKAWHAKGTRSSSKQEKQKWTVDLSEALIKVGTAAEYGNVSDLSVY